MPEKIILTTDKNRVAVSPGAKTEAAVTIQNLTTLVDDVSVSVSGIDGAWAQVVPPHVPVFAQGEATVRVIFQPPVDPVRAVAGVYPVQIAGKMQEAAGQQAEVAVDLEVQFGGEYRLELGSGTALSGQEASFPLRVHNQANAPLTVKCFGEDPQNSFWYKFDPFQLTIPPGADAETTLSIRSRQPGGQRVTFLIKVQGEWAISGMGTIAAPPQQINAQWEMAAPASLAVSVNPPRAQSAAAASYQVTVFNPGSDPETVVLAASSSSGQMGFRFEPPQLAVAPGGKSSAVLTAWAVAPGVPGTVDFWVTAKSVNGKAHPGSSQAAFVQLAQAPAPKRPSWLIPVIAAIVILLLVCVVAVGLLYYFLGPTLNPTGGASLIPSLTRSIFYGSNHLSFG
jgi:hypothetical protein